MMEKPEHPFFSIIVSAYNREEIILRCVESCLAQTDPDFELIVVDDCSTDRTVELLQSVQDPRLRILQHPENRGASPARYTGVSQASGAWIVLIDSDWTLEPHALQTFRAAIAPLPPEVSVVRGRLKWDTGWITPTFVPSEPIGYEGRIRWVEKEGGHDAAMCARRDVFQRVNYSPDRRGIMEGLFQLDLAQSETILYLEAIVGMEYSGAGNSISRGKSQALVQALRRNAPDMLWMSETTLQRHGEALRKWGPNHYLTFVQTAALQSFYLGKRKAGAQYMLEYLRARPGEIKSWLMLLAGLLGSTAALNATLLNRKLRR